MNIIFKDSHTIKERERETMNIVYKDSHAGKCGWSQLPTSHGATNPDPARPQVVKRWRSLDIKARGTSPREPSGGMFPKTR